jgi:hypothetical protein
MPISSREKVHGWSVVGRQMAILRLSGPIFPVRSPHRQSVQRYCQYECVLGSMCVDSRPIALPIRKASDHANSQSANAPITLLVNRRALF